MRTSEELVEELHRRMDARKKRLERRRLYGLCAGACAACLALVVLFAMAVSRLPLQSPGAGVYGTAASIFADRAALGYVAVAIVAFCLGAFVTIFCFRLKKHREEEPDDDRKL